MRKQAAVDEKKVKNISKQTINIIRTTQRNNIDLTHIADNKANVLLSLNAIMLSFLLPLVLANTDEIVEHYLYVPLLILAATCFATIYISTIVLKPSDFDKFRKQLGEDSQFSPFFFGNFYKMEMNEFFDHLDDSLSDSELLKVHIAQDLYYVGHRLGVKMSRIRLAFDIFIFGLFTTILSAVVVLCFF